MKRRAFTLVELIVVISIIALLIALLLPALSTAKQAALSVQCESNLRSLGQMSMEYSDANKDFLLSNAPPNSPSSFAYAWNDQLFDWDYSLPAEVVSWMTYKMSIRNTIIDGYSYGALRQKYLPLFLCPSATIPLTDSYWNVNPYVSPTTYAVNPNVFVWWNNYPYTWIVSHYNSPKRAGSIKNPAQVIGIGDANQPFGAPDAESFYAFDWTGYNSPTPNVNLDTVIPPNFNEPDVDFIAGNYDGFGGTYVGGSGLRYRHFNPSPNTPLNSPASGVANAEFMDGHVAPIRAGALHVYNVATGF